MGKGGGSGGGKPDKSTVSHGNEASGAQTIHASERRWTALSCLTGHDHTFFPLDYRKYMLVSIYYVDYGKIS